MITEPRWYPAQIQMPVSPQPVRTRHDIRADRQLFASVLAGETELRLDATDAAMAVDYADVLHLIAPGGRQCCCRLVTRVRQAPVQGITSGNPSLIRCRSMPGR